MSAIKAIQTYYKGFHFRSRLEARWAIFFDEIKLKWQYEPEGYVLPDGVQYLPDFWWPEVEFFAEVKPLPFTKEEETKAANLPGPCWMLVDVPPIEDQIYYLAGSREEWCFTDITQAAFKLPGGLYDRKKQERIITRAGELARSKRF